MTHRLVDPQERSQQQRNGSPGRGVPKTRPFCIVRFVMRSLSASAVRQPQQSPHCGIVGKEDEIANSTRRDDIQARAILARRLGDFDGRATLEERNAASDPLKR